MCRLKLLTDLKKIYFVNRRIESIIPTIELGTTALLFSATPPCCLLRSYDLRTHRVAGHQGEACQCGTTHVSPWVGFAVTPFQDVRYWARLVRQELNAASPPTRWIQACIVIQHGGLERMNKAHAVYQLFTKRVNASEHDMASQACTLWVSPLPYSVVELHSGCMWGAPTGGRRCPRRHWCLSAPPRRSRPVP
jgi:hypothetical protein